ncbi:tetracenomycin polyketide synthesis hydroxylase, partial [Streptomyces sp. NPDC057654]
DSYDAERRPAGWFAADESSRRIASFQNLAAAPDPTLAHPYILATGAFQHTAGALVSGPDDADDPEPVTEFAPAGRVGTRVPHRWLDGARTRSTIDLAGPGWCLLAGPEAAAPRTDRLPVHRHDLDFLPAGQCLLLRPDQIVAWRGTDPGAAVEVYDGLLRAPAASGAGG